uniref:Uncharacterized protein n=1 Tax=Anguilla anguilla TaxID=7936 RepID=A0A0E9RFU9_ANGAN
MSATCLWWQHELSLWCRSPWWCSCSTVHNGLASHFCHLGPQHLSLEGD